MPYRKPGAYARFVRTAGAVNSPGATRVMAIIGTGKLFFDKINEAVLRTPGTTSDELNFGNVYEIYEITNKPLKDGNVQPGARVFRKGVHFELMEGKIIAWKLKTAPTVQKIEDTSEGEIFKTAVSVSVNKDYKVRDGKFRVQITYIDNDGSSPNLGTFAVIDHETEEVLGEYTVSNEPVNAIPGVDLIVTDTFFPKLDEKSKPVINTATGFVVPQTKVGDYVLIETKAGVLNDTLDDAATNPLPTKGEVYYVSYAYKKPEEEFKPKVFTDYSDVVNEYGNYDVTASGRVINSLALGAEIAFLNGVNPIVCVQAKNDSDFEIKKAIDMLERDVPGIKNVNTIIPLTTSKVVAAYVMEHVTKMSNSAIGKERMTYIAAEPGETVTQSADNAAGFNNERVVYIVPGEATKEVKDIYTGKVSIRKVPGCYLAVAVAALGLKNDPAEPLTNKTITGFTGFTTSYTESEKNLMAEKGCLVLEQYGYNMRVRHGITTSVAEVNSNEITLVQIKDYVIEAARTLLADLYVGRKLMPTLLGDIQTTLANILAQFVAQEIIIGFSGLSVKRSSEDPRSVDVSFEIEAVYPLNYINISFSFSGVN